MRRPIYISGDMLDDIRNAYGCGVPTEKLASQLGIAEDALRRLLGLPQWKPAASDNAEPELDLWAVDRLDAAL